MAYVIAEPCIAVKDNSCVEVCPVDCIHPTPDEADYGEHDQLYIDPDECIDCGACEPACPVSAIFSEDDVPDSQRDFVALNAELAKEWKPIVEKKAAPPDADDWATIKDKRGELDRG